MSTGAPDPTPKKRRPRKKKEVVLDEETDRQERELRMKIAQSLHNQYASRTQVETEEVNLQQKQRQRGYSDDSGGGGGGQIMYNDFMMMTQQQQMMGGGMVGLCDQSNGMQGQNHVGVNNNMMGYQQQQQGQYGFHNNMQQNDDQRNGPGQGGGGINNGGGGGGMGSYEMQANVKMQMMQQHFQEQEQRKMQLQLNNNWRQQQQLQSDDNQQQYRTQNSHSPLYYSGKNGEDMKGSGLSREEIMRQLRMEHERLLGEAQKRRDAMNEEGNANLSEGGNMNNMYCNPTMDNGNMNEGGMPMNYCQQVPNQNNNFSQQHSQEVFQNECYPSQQQGNYQYQRNNGVQQNAQRVQQIDFTQNQNYIGLSESLIAQNKPLRAASETAYYQQNNGYQYQQEQRSRSQGDIAYQKQSLYQHNALPNSEPMMSLGDNLCQSSETPTLSNISQNAPSQERLEHDQLFELQQNLLKDSAAMMNFENQRQQTINTSQHQNQGGAQEQVFHKVFHTSNKTPNEVIELDTSVSDIESWLEASGKSSLGGNSSMGFYSVGNMSASFSSLADGPVIVDTFTSNNQKEPSSASGKHSAEKASQYRDSVVDLAPINEDGSDSDRPDVLGDVLEKSDRSAASGNSLMMSLAEGDLMDSNLMGHGAFNKSGMNKSMDLMMSLDSITYNALMSQSKSGIDMNVSLSEFLDTDNEPTAGDGGGKAKAKPPQGHRMSSLSSTSQSKGSKSSSLSSNNQSSVGKESVASRGSRRGRRIPNENERPSIMSEISNWTQSNPFDDSEYSGDAPATYTAPTRRQKDPPSSSQRPNFTIDTAEADALHDSVDVSLSMMSSIMSEDLSQSLQSLQITLEKREESDK
eukprot:g1147.t1 g1147   contig10:1484113-1486683(+)